MDPIDNNVIPLDTGGNPEPNPEPAPAQEMNISEAGQALLNALSAAETPAAPEEITIPVADALEGLEGNPEPPAEPAAVQPPAAPERQVSLDAVKDDILSGIKELFSANQQPQNAEVPLDEQPPEDIEATLNDDEFMEKFSENPTQAITELADKIANGKVAAEMTKLMDKMKPLLDQSEQIAMQNKVKDTLAEFIGKKTSDGNDEFPDAENYFPRLVEIIKSENLPQDNPDTYKNTYYRAALEAARAIQPDAAASQGKTLDDYLADDAEVQKILGNEKVRNAVITEYLKSLAGNAKPQVINGSGNVLPPATPPNKITDFNEANKMLRSQL